MEINKRNRNELKAYFVSNAIPTEDNFADLIDAGLNQMEDGLAKLPGDPLSIEAAGDATGQKEVINFYESFADADPAWVLSLNPTTAADPSTARAGFNLSDGAGNSRLFIDRTSGKVGIGTSDPSEELDVRGVIRADGIRTTSYVAGDTVARTTSSKNTWGDFPDLIQEFELSVATNVLIFYQVTGPGGGLHLVTRLAIDDEEKRRTRSITGNTDYWSPSGLWIGSLAAGQHTAKVQYRTPQSSTLNPTNDWQNRVLRIIVFGG